MIGFRALVVGIVLVVLLAGCVVSTYLWIDRSITLAHVSDSLEFSERSAKNLESLLQREWRGRAQAEVVEQLKRAAEASGHIVVKQDTQGVVWFDDIPFRFEAGRLKSIGSP